MIVLDTHAWIWWTNGSDRLSSAAGRAIEKEREIGVCAISCWELAMLVSGGRLGLDRDPLLWIRESLSQPRVLLLPLTPEIAVASAGFGPDYPKDPADRLIIATAQNHRAEVATADRKMRSLRQVNSIW